MKVTHPDDLDGRTIAVEQRLRMMQESLAAMVSAYRTIGAPSEDALAGLADTIEEVADEVRAIHNAQIAEEGERFLARRPRLRRMIEAAESGGAAR